MTNDQLKAFLAKVKSDDSLKSKLINSASPEQIISLAKDNGHDFTIDHWKELSLEEIESLAGGRCTSGGAVSCGPL